MSASFVNLIVSIDDNISACEWYALCESVWHMFYNSEPSLATPEPGVVLTPSRRYIDYGDPLMILL